jgi:hypothetical protein
MLSMLNRLLLISLLALPGVAMADAVDGEFMGYKLDSVYERGASTKQTTTATGNLLITAEQPVKPADIDEVTLLTTPGSLTIGYIDASSWFATEAEAREMGGQYVRLLRAKYPGWSYGREGLDSTLRINEVNFDNVPHNLRLRLSQGMHEGERKWRFSMTLGWLADAAQEVTWRDLSISEQVAGQKNSSEQLLEDSDLRGL